MQEWILHDSHSLKFRDPFGAVPCLTKICLRLWVHAERDVDSVFLHLCGLVDSKIEMIAEKCDNNGKIYYAEISSPATPGLIWYCFSVVDEGKTYYYGSNQAGLGGKGSFRENLPPFYQITVYKEGTETPGWFKDAVMYQIFVDRFYNGLEGGKVLNPKKGCLIHPHWEDTPVYACDPQSGRILAYDFFGGNLSGIIKKLPYLKELGITVLYLNPIFESPSNHKYDTGDYKKIDPMYGDEETFEELCRKAGEMGIKIILDGVFSHTGSDSIYFNKEGNYPGTGAYQSKDSPYYKWYRFNKYPECYECWWGVDILPNVNEMEPSYLRFIIDDEDSVIKKWMRKGAKGWRLDVADELPDEFIRRLRQVMKEQDSSSVLIGEVWEDASNKVSYGKLREYLLGEELDSVMNYPFRNILVDFVLGRKDAWEANLALMSLYENYPLQHFYSTMNLLGSHDVARILTVLGEAPPEDSLSKIEQRKFRLAPDQLKLAIARLKLLSLWQMTFPGVPSIYYGDEAGMEGYTDPLNRGTYPWGNENIELLNWYKKIIALRHEYAVLRTGEWVPLYAKGDVYSYLRRIVGGKDVFGQPRPDNVAVALFNRSRDKKAVLSLDVGPWCSAVMFDVVHDNRAFPVEDGKLRIVLEPLEGRLLIRDVPGLEKRKCGILLHLTSLPSKYGIGDLGRDAYRFVDFLEESRQSLWQILPLHPVGYCNSPYQSVSAFAGNHLLISPDFLFESGLLTKDELKPALELAASFDENSVEFDKVKSIKESLFRKAFQRFRLLKENSDYEHFLHENGYWLRDYALFMALKARFGEKPWHRWERAIALRQPEAMAYWQDKLQLEIDYHKFLQFVFFKQWIELKNYASSRAVKIIGDLPIFVAHDSSDVWAHQRLFNLDELGRPARVSGVPPDYFSKTGQRWGNPVYNWNEMAEDDYRWWRERIGNLLKMVDIIRIDHFRGFEAYWEIPADEETAVNGRWVKGPGARFFAVIQKYLGQVPLIAEDLGFITPEVEELKNSFSFPGMKVLQFSFDFGADGQCLPVECPKNTVFYTGTHDNDTLLGWYKSCLVNSPKVVNCINEYTGLLDKADEHEICWKLIEFAYQSSADTVIVPLQDILCLGSDARMNHPGTTWGNWKWRFRKESLTPEIAGRLRELAVKYRRCNGA